MFGDFIGQTSTVVGNGSDLTLGDPVGSGVTWRSRFADGEAVFYLDTTRNAQKRELGWGVLTHGTPDKIERNVLFSTQADARVNWAVDDIHTAYSVPVAVVMSYMLNGGLGEALPAWAPNGSTRWSYEDTDISTLWKHLLKTAAGEIELGRHDVAKEAYFSSPRRPWTATGTAGKTVDADDIGGIFTFNNSAAARTMTLPAHDDDGIGHGFRVGGLGLTKGGSYGIVVTPAATDGIEGGADAAPLTIPGGVRFDVVWDQASDTWRVEYLNAPVTGPRHTIEGLTYANGSDATNDIDIAAGGCWDSTGAYWMQLAAITKQLDATWTAGTNQGGRLSGSLADGDFNIWAIGRPGTGAIDVGFETAANTTPTMPANYTYYRKIGWFRRASGAIVAFHTYETEGGGIEFAWDNLATDVTATIGASRSLVSLDRVPAGIQVQANISIENNTQNAVNVCCPDQVAVTPAFGGGIGVAGIGVSLSAGSQSVQGTTAKNQVRVRTNTNREVAMHASGAGVQVYASVISFEWPRR